MCGGHGVVFIADHVVTMFLRTFKDTNEAM